MENQCKATITLGDAKITIEGPAQFVEAQVGRFAVDQGVSEVAATPTAGAAMARFSERQLILAKKPKGHHEIVAVLAFALTEAGVKEFTEEDIRKAYLRADVRPPRHVSQALRDAKNKFDYIDTGSSRGKYQLTNHGDSTVRFDLPRAEL